MSRSADAKKRTGIELSAAVLTGGMLGLLNLLGPLPLAGLTLFLLAALLIILFKNVYHGLVLLGVVFLACVFIEPAPSDLLFCAIIPLGLCTGVFHRQSLGKASIAICIFIIYFAACLPGTLYLADHSSAMRYLAITFYLFLLSVFICMYTQRSTVVSILRVYILAACLSFAAGLMGILGLFPDLLMADLHRVRGLFKDANVFGPFFVPAVILLWDDIKRKALLKAPAIFHVMGIVLFSLGTLFSFSRAAWINLITAGLIYFAINLKALRLRLLLRTAFAAVVVIVAAALLLTSSPMQEIGVLEFLQHRAKLHNYDKDRFTTQRGGLELVIRYPMGVGPGQFENKIASVTGQELSAHSLYIRIAAENGIAGGIAFFSALVVILLMLWLKHRKISKHSIPLPFRNDVDVIISPQDTGISPAVLISILSGILVNSLVIDTLHWRHLFFFIGLALYRIKDTE